MLQPGPGCQVEVSYHHIINFALFKECLGASSVLNPSLEKVCSWVAGNDTHDSSLDDCASAIHAGRVSDEKSTTSKRNADSGRIRDCVEFGVGVPEIFLWSISTALVFVCSAPSRCAVITERTNFKRRAEDKRTNLRARILAELRGCIDNPHVFCEFAEVEGHFSPLRKKPPVAFDLVELVVADTVASFSP